MVKCMQLEEVSRSLFKGVMEYIHWLLEVVGPLILRVVEASFSIHLFDTPLLVCCPSSETQSHRIVDIRSQVPYQ